MGKHSTSSCFSEGQNGFVFNKDARTKILHYTSYARGIKWYTFSILNGLILLFLPTFHKCDAVTGLKQLFFLICVLFLSSSDINISSWLLTCHPKAPGIPCGIRQRCSRVSSACDAELLNRWHRVRCFSKQENAGRGVGQGLSKGSHTWLSLRRLKVYALFETRRHWSFLILTQ